MKNFQYYLEMSQKSEIAETPTPTPKSKIKPGSEIDFQNIPNIKNFIETNYSTLNIRKSFRKPTRVDGTQWGEPQTIAGKESKDFYNFLAKLPKAKKIEISGPHASDKFKDAIQVDLFYFQFMDDANIIEFGSMSKFKDNGPWKKKLKP